MQKLTHHMLQKSMGPQMRSLAPLTSFVKRFTYHQNVLDHYKNPRNVGSMDKSDPSVGTGLVGAPACGDVMKL